ncbi:MAG: carbon-nitrogen hydrolase family protein [Gammaproteobacteria bacterium]|nr:carbon-nitrogen hydrolase family protein [Gammaproteobacteria bacterium]
MSEAFKVACIQNCAANDMAANLATVECLLRSAHAQGAALACLPEFFCNLEPADGNYYDNGFEADAHPALAAMGALARELGLWLLLGSIPVKAGDRKVHNRSIVLDPQGAIVATYNKIHLFDVAIKDGQSYKESNGVAAGGEAVIATLPWGGLGLTICYDVRFPHLYRRLAQHGASFLSIPAAFTAKTGAAHWHTLVRARAIETGSYVFAPGQCGTRPWGRATYGHSLIVDPWGTVLADGGEEEGVIVAEVDPARVTEVRRMIPSLTHDRDIAGPLP